MDRKPGSFIKEKGKKGLTPNPNCPAMRERSGKNAKKPAAEKAEEVTDAGE